MKSIPTVQKYMTTQPHTIGYDQTLAKAKEIMSEYRIRHLPVLKNEKLVGVVTDRDVSLLLSFKDTDPQKTYVYEVYSELPYSTSPEAHLDEVVAYMAEKKYGSALVVSKKS